MMQNVQEMAEKVPGLGLVNSTLSGLLEALLNQAVKMDDAQGVDFAPCDEKVVQLTLTDLKQTLFLIYQLEAEQTTNGHFTVQRQLMGQADCHIQTSCWHLIQRDGEFAATGDADLAQAFMTALQQLEIDWEEQLSKVTGDLVAFKVGHAVRETQKVGREAKQKAGDTLREYLQFEIHVLPTQSQINHFGKQVHETSLGVDALEARIQALLHTSKS